MKIPILQEQVDVKPAPFQPLQLPQPAAQAPTQAAQAGERLGQTVQGAGEHIARALIDLQERKDKQQTIEVHTQFLRDQQTLLRDQQTDDKGRPRGLLNRQLGQADGSAVEYDQAYEGMRKKYLDSVAGPQQKAELSALMDQHHLTAREQVISHEIVQGREAFRGALEADLQLVVDNAPALVSPKQIADQLDLKNPLSAAHRQADGLRRLGVDAKTTELNREAFAAKLVKGSVAAQLEVDPQHAQETFDQVKGHISPASATEIQKLIDGRIIHVKQAEAWGLMAGLRRTDGTIDDSSAEDIIKKVAGGMRPEYQAEVRTFLKGMAATHDTQLKERRSADNRAFLNEVDKQFRAKKPVESVLPLAAKYAFDGEDWREKEKAVWERYQDEQTFLSRAQKELRPDQKAALAEAKDIGSALGKKLVDIGGGIKMARSEVFYNEIVAASLNKTGDEIRALTQEKRKKVDSGHWWQSDKDKYVEDFRMRRGEAILRAHTPDEAEAVKKIQARGEMVTPERVAWVVSQMRAGKL